MKRRHLGGIFGHFGALKAAPGLMNGLFTTTEENSYRKNQMDFTGDTFQVTVPLFNIGMSFH